ncbi:MAG: exostosin family protein [Candidatus Pacebacteria bacterium]|nr:exostosin family protein [Candidatus Paceibacterota bacterium]MBP9832181.1 exostosin family protein [Candidatus Paceibacterota bacterium]
MEPIKLYAPDTYREPKISMHTELMFPFWGVTAKDTMPYMKAAALQYQYSKDDFVLVEKIEDADFVVIPYSYERFKVINPAKVQMIVSEATNAQKPILVDGAGDLEYNIDIPNSVIFRVSQYQYSKKPNEITIPFPAEDLLETYRGGELQIRKKPERPSVGFTGWAGMSLERRFKTYVKELPVTSAALIDEKRGAEHKGVLFRERALKALQKNKFLEARFTARSSYSGHVATIQGSVADNRREFVENLLGSDYALCVRGDANASVRFYEALSLGRIPLFLDTACVLPLEDTINYRDFCVFVDWRDTDRIGDILVDFHSSLTPQRFEEMQREARKAYREYLRFDSFSKHLSAMLRTYTNKI